jgi:hypothetical protein
MKYSNELSESPLVSTTYSQHCNNTPAKFPPTHSDTEPHNEHTTVEINMVIYG